MLSCNFVNTSSITHAGKTMYFFYALLFLVVNAIKSIAVAELAPADLCMLKNSDTEEEYLR